jgi:hypothetical protein
MLRSRKPSKQSSYIKFTKCNTLESWREERSELSWRELLGNVPNWLILLLKRTQSNLLERILSIDSGHYLAITPRQNQPCCRYLLRLFQREFC